jgi:hypothetical protein
MARNFVSPALFDISADIAGEIPVNLIHKWAELDPSHDAQSELLQPFITKGIVVCSDSAGLSKLSQQMGLIEVMQLVSQPKDIIHGYGRAIKGKSIGTWFADNTEMLYPDDIDVDALLAHMVAAQSEIANLQVQVGMSVHRGSFIELGKGLYGADADFAELLAENHTAGREIALSHSLKDLTSHHHRLRLREDLNLRHPVYSLDYEGWSATAAKIDEQYPIPFDQGFYDDIRSGKVDSAEAKYSQEQLVVLVSVDHEDEDLLLDKLSNLALANFFLQKSALTHQVRTIKSNGQLGIYLADDAGQALEFARATIALLGENNFVSTAGAAYGTVLLFNLMNGDKEIAGNPVNIASKFAEDIGESGHVYVHDSISLPQKFKRLSESIEVEVSNVRLKGWQI